MMKETPQYKKAAIRLDYEIAMLRKHCKKNGIEYSVIEEKSGLTNISRFMNNKVQTPSFITFLLIAEALGFEVKVELINLNSYDR